MAQTEFSRPQLKAKDLMTSPVITVRPETPVREVSRLMLQHRISGLRVVGEDERIVGIITESDLLQKASGPSPLQQVVQNLFEFDLAGVDARRVEARVRRGIVHITGWVKTRLEAEALTSVMRSIDGVVDVDNSNLAWEKDNPPRPGRR